MATPSTPSDTAATAAAVALPAPAFPPVQFLPAKRLTGMAAAVIISPDDDHNHKDLDGSGRSASTTTTETAAPSPTLPSLERQTSVMGNILCVQISSSDNSNDKKYIWLQRKIRNLRHGSIRVGFVLKPPSPTMGKDKEEDNALQHAVETTNNWQLETRMAAASSDNSQQQGEQQQQQQPVVQMVAVRMEDKAYVSTEHAALQFVGQHCAANNNNNEDDDDDNDFVLGGHGILLAADNMHIYTIFPYDLYNNQALTLSEYCASQRRRQPQQQQPSVAPLDSDTARNLFVQILKGLETLQRLKMCHRNLSPATILLRPIDPATSTTSPPNVPARYRCTITNLESALRVPHDDKTNKPCLVQAPDEESSLPTSSGIRQIQYTAPELLLAVNGSTSKDDDNNKVTPAPPAFDGYAADVWSVGVLLYFMLSTDPLFVAPVREDRIFRHTVLQGEFHLQNNDDDAKDLLQKMLKVKPEERLTLPQILEHPWVATASSTKHDDNATS